MKLYVKATSEKPKLSDIHTEWEELEDGSGIMFRVFSDSDELLFEELFDYQDVDSDAIYDSAIDMANVVLSQEYELTADAMEALASR